MGSLEGRVAIVTGAGRGLGRAHALFLAAEGASVVVNDLGGDVGGGGHDSRPSEQVVEEIRSGGGKAVASGHNVADWDEAQAMIRMAVDSFGDLHVLVNNAGIVRDRTLANMSELDWDAVVNVHLKGHAAPTSHALAYWRRRAHELGSPVRASVIHTSSLSGLIGNFGQANYSAAKLGVLALSRVASLEGDKYGVRSNVVSPSGRTRIAMTVPSIAQRLEAPRDSVSSILTILPTSRRLSHGWHTRAVLPMHRSSTSEGTACSCSQCRRSSTSSGRAAAGLWLPSTGICRHDW